MFPALGLETRSRTANGIDVSRVLEVLYLDPGKSGDLTEFLPIGRIEKLCQEYLDAESFATQLFDELKSSILAPERLYNEIMAFLFKIDKKGSLHSLLAICNENTSRSMFKIVLDNIDGFMRFTDPKRVIDYLQALPRYDGIVNVLRNELERIRNPEIMKKLVLRTIPQLGQFSAYDILYTIYETQHPDNNVTCEARQFVEKIEPNFLRFYENLDEERKHPRGKLFFCPITSNLTELLVQLGTPALENNDRFKIIDILWENMPQTGRFERIIIESVQNRIHEEQPIILRRYQQELCKVAIEGKNTIVTAPTGSGKTVIAANILKHHFEQARINGKQSKALFMTPNSVILQQQASSLSNYLKHLYLVKIIQGAENVPVRGTILSNDLIVATPQMIVNLCNEHSQFENDPDINVTQFFLSTFSIIIFDECHNTQKNSPYSNIMKIYHEMKNTGVMPSGHCLPQIIGLTASLGVGQAKNELEAVDHIADLAANMDVHELSVVREHIGELQQFSPIVPDNLCFCDKRIDETNLQFATTLAQFMTKMEKVMINLIESTGDFEMRGRNSPDTLDVGPVRRERVKGEFKLPPLDKDHEAYLNWVANHKILISESKFERDKQVFEILEILEKSYWTLEHNSNFNSQEAYNLINEFMEQQKPSLHMEVIRTWEEYHHILSQARNSTNPMIEKVVENLIELYNRNDDFRAIVFIKTRVGAVTLAKILSSIQELKDKQIRTDYISGLNKGSDELAASKRAQQEKIDKFAEGSIKVLVATSVAEEGLDIAKCNLVVKYNYATNEIAHVQRRGRGRAANSKCILITNNIRLKEQESSNKTKEHLMYEAMNMILKKHINFENIVRSKMIAIWKNIQDEKAAKESIIQKQLNSNIQYKILCKKCKTLLCMHSDIRAEKTQYFVCNPNFWKLIRKVMFSPSEQEAEIRFGGKGKIQCKQCYSGLGRLIEVRSVELPCLAADSIVLEYCVNSQIELKMCRKWKDILKNHFTPQDLRALDIKTMQAENRQLNFEVDSLGEILNILRD
ncbi:unnamed protein product [Caenorhabditis angaria]|uniref:RNA helicase n=1 Tax=Caenorhabditis angaria TaxID=860376 RepID=A0A9P1N2P3_9PELO|nr:unnamed protein product [Caenorhabditis angaria]